MENRTSLLTVVEFANHLGITPAAVRRWLLEQKIASVKLGRCVRVPASEIDRLVQEGTRPAKARK